MWKWLGKASTQKTLSFIGAGIAALVALLVQMGVFKEQPVEKKEPVAAVPVPSAPSASPVSPSPSTDQSIQAGDNSNVVGVQGNNNQINVGK